jgi:predicted nucleotidyltransferase
MITNKQRERILEVVAPYRPILIGVFGSYSRGEAGVDSDLDLLIDFDPPLDLLTIIGLEQELSEKLELSVDLITVRALHPTIRANVEKDLILLE